MERAGKGNKNFLKTKREAKCFFRIVGNISKKEKVEYQNERRKSGGPDFFFFFFGGRKGK